MKRTVFTIGEYPKAYIGYTSGRLWNGWATPYFEFEEAKRVAEGFNECAEYPIQYDKVYDQFYVLDTETSELETWKGEDIHTTLGIKHLYGIGAYSWVWDDVGSVTERRKFAEQIEEFIFYHDTHNYMDEYDLKREEMVKSIMHQLLTLTTYAEAYGIYNDDNFSADEKIEKLGGILHV